MYSERNFIYLVAVKFSNVPIIKGNINDDVNFNLSCVLKMERMNLFGPFFSISWFR